MIEINTDYNFISPYPIMILLSFLVGIIGMYLLNLRDGIRKDVAGYLCLLAPVMSVFFGIVLTYISSGFQYFGLSSVGGLIGMYLASLTMALISGKQGELGIMTKNCTLMLPLMYSISKIGCLFAGCCHGIAYHGAFRIHYTGKITDTIDVFPVQLAETVLFLIIFLIGILGCRNKKSAVWMIFTISALSKCLLDFLRESHIGQILSFNQVLCGILFLFGISMMYHDRKARQLKNF